MKRGFFKEFGAVLVMLLSLESFSFASEGSCPNRVFAFSDTGANRSSTINVGEGSAKLITNLGIATDGSKIYPIAKGSGENKTEIEFSPNLKKGRFKISNLDGNELIKVKIYDGKGGVVENLLPYIKDVKMSGNAFKYSIDSDSNLVIDVSLDRDMDEELNSLVIDTPDISKISYILKDRRRIPTTDFTPAYEIDSGCFALNSSDPKANKPRTAKNVSINGYVWFDDNVDGLSKDENNVVDIEVKLYNDSEELLGTTRTDSEGRYIFNDLEPNRDYIVKFTTPNSFLVTKGGGDSDVDSDGVAKIKAKVGANNEIDMGIICSCDKNKL